ncbi:MAG TPA: hypothetical protein VE868_10135 [Balneolaceae bacterium]|nr:hypothetical protein [Balneolaceae bacterium]
MPIVSEISIVSIPSGDHHSQSIDNFLQSLRDSRCIFYASDILNIIDEGNFNQKDIQQATDRLLQVFNTLHISSENHVYEVFRSTPGYTYKDWKLSRLACLYLLLKGDPTDLSTIAQQQNTLLDHILNDFSQNKYNSFLREK